MRTLYHAGGSPNVFMFLFFAAKYERLRRIFILSSNSTIGTIVAVGALGQQHVTVSPLLTVDKPILFDR